MVKENPFKDKEPVIIDPVDKVIPFDLVPLPSKGELYDDEHPLCGVESLELKPIGTYEENILHSEALIKKGTVFDELIKSCLKNKLVNPSKLFVGDKNAILFSIRISGWGEEYAVKIRCNFCSEDFVSKFNLKKLSTKPLSEEGQKIRVEGHKNLFEFIDKRNNKIHFSILTDEEQSEVRKIQERRRIALQKMGRNVDIDTTISDMHLSRIKSINGNKDKNNIKKYIDEQMDRRDSKKLRNLANSIEPQIEMEQLSCCSACGKEDLYTIPMTIDFFWPPEED